MIPTPPTPAPRLPSADAQAVAAAVAPSPSDGALRSSIAERFAGAYEAQLGYLSRVAAAEQRWLQTDVESLRGAAYVAQRSAAEHKARAEATRQALGHGHLDAIAAREALGMCHRDIAHEEVALRAAQEALHREEASVAALHARCSDECAELSAECATAQRRRRVEEDRAAEVSMQLAQARAERDAEAQVAREHERRAQAAMRSREQALQGLRSHEDLAVRTLKDAVAKLEADFSQERADFAERDRRAMAQTKELERQLDQRRRMGVELGQQKLLGPGGAGGIWLPS